MCILHKADQYCAEPPADKNACNPFSGAPVLDDQCSRNLEQKVSQEEDSCSEAEHLLREPERGAHREFCECNICTIEVRDDVQDEDERQDAAANVPLSFQSVSHAVFKV